MMTRSFLIGISISYFCLFFFVENRHVQRAGTATNWCCDIEVQNTTRNETTVHVEKKVVTSFIPRIHRRPCRDGEQPAETITGYFGTDEDICHDVHNETFLETISVEVPVNLEVIIPGVCPQVHLNCCNGYELFQGQCVAHGSMDSLQELINAGLLGR